MIKKRITNYRGKKLKAILEFGGIHPKTMPKIFNFLFSDKKNYTEIEMFKDHSGDGSPSFTRRRETKIGVGKAYSFETANFNGAVYFLDGRSTCSHYGWGRVNTGRGAKNGWYRQKEYIYESDPKEKYLGIIYSNKKRWEPVNLEMIFSSSPERIEIEILSIGDQIRINCNNEYWREENIFIEVDFKKKFWKKIE